MTSSTRNNTTCPDACARNAIIRFFTFDFCSIGGSADIHRLTVGGKFDRDSIESDVSSSCNENDTTTTKPNIIKHKLGRDIVWRPDICHYEVDRLELHRYIGDPEVDQLLQVCDDCNGHFDDTIAECANIYHRWKKDDPAIQLSKEKQMMKDFYQHYYEDVPSWVDYDQIQRGIDVFVAFAPVAGLALYYMSLVPGFSIPKIAAVLQQTRYLSPPSTKQQIQERLMDTGGFIVSVMKSASSILSSDSIRPGEEGWTAALQVRVLHAKVRRSLLQKEGWNMEQNGIPINQEDLAATLLAFSVNVLSGIEFVAGRPLSTSRQLDYLALWRYLGWLLGIHCHNDENRKHVEGITFNVAPLDPCGPPLRQDEGKIDPDPLATIVHARASLESIICHLMHPNDSSVSIAHHLLRVGRSRPGTNGGILPSSSESFQFLFRCCMCRYFVGDALADELQLPYWKARQKDMIGWKYYLAFAVSTALLIVLRVHTLMVIRFSFYHDYFYRWHKENVVRFHTIWKEKHAIRMEKAARASLRLKERRSSTSHQRQRRRSSCPFALVMPPTDLDKLKVS